MCLGIFKEHGELKRLNKIVVAHGVSSSKIVTSGCRFGPQNLYSRCSLRPSIVGPLTTMVVKVDALGLFSQNQPGSFGSVRTKICRVTTKNNF